MKPSWDEIPKNHDWLSMDPDGFWISWESEPRIEESWVTKQLEWCSCGDFIVYDAEPMSEWDNWRKSLEKRP